MILLDKEDFKREFYFFQGDPDEDECFLIEDRIELAKESQLFQGRCYLQAVLDDENIKKYENKRIEINPLKTVGVNDYRDNFYIEKLNNMNVLPDRNKRKATYV